MKVNRILVPAAEKAAQENAAALAQKNADLIEYIAMMADVEIPTDEEVRDDE